MKSLKVIFNAYLGSYNYYHRKLRLGNRPRVSGIEITNYCNLVCPNCPRHLMKRKVGFMDFELFRRIIDKSKRYTDLIYLHCFGEPLFHPDLAKFIAYCIQNGVKCEFSTNATVLNEEKSLMILNSGLENIWISLDATTKQTYEKLRRNADFEQTKRNITEFLNLKHLLKKKKPGVGVQIINMKDNEKEIVPFVEEWKRLADYVIIKPFLSWANQLPGVCIKSRPQRHPCFKFWHSYVILWNGDMVPCCMDYDGKMVLGNIAKDDLWGIWNSSELIRIREDQIAGNYKENPLCKDCAEWIGGPQDNYYPLSRLWRKIFLPLMGRGKPDQSEGLIIIKNES